MLPTTRFKGWQGHGISKYLLITHYRPHTELKTVLGSEDVVNETVVNVLCSLDAPGSPEALDT